MFIDDFVWLTEIANKVATKHRVTPHETEESILQQPQIPFR